MSETTNPQETRQPRNIIEQTLFGVQVTNDNIVAIHARMDNMEAKSMRYMMPSIQHPSLTFPARMTRIRQ